MSGRVIDEHEIKAAMRLGGRYDYVPVYNTWPKAAVDLGVDAEWLVRRARDLAEVAPQAFSDAASDRAIRATHGEFVRRVAERSARCAHVVR